MLRDRVWMLALLAAGCQGSESEPWLTGVSFGWANFNHRLSYWSASVTTGERGTVAASGIVGGTSTIGSAPPLADGCDLDTCREYPFLDSADMAVSWMDVQASHIAYGRGGGTVLATADGAVTSISIPLDGKARGLPVVTIQGFDLDTTEPLFGEGGCYVPANGWLPTRVAIELGEPALAADGRTVTLDVSATFAAGLTHEPERQCLDDAIDQAQVGVSLQLVAAVTTRDVGSATIANAESYALGDGGRSHPDPQPDPDPAQRTLALSFDGPAALGWSRVDFRFHTQETDGRGAYVRTLSFSVDGANDFASGHATNYSPLTQFSGFDYAFEGTVQAIALDEWPELRHAALLATPVLLDADGHGLTQALPLSE